MCYYGFMSMEQQGGQETPPKNPRQKILTKIRHAAEKFLSSKLGNKAIREESGQPQKEHAQNNKELHFPDSNKYYQELTERELIPPDPNEIIHVHGFTNTPEDQKDLQKLVEAGLSEEAVRKGEIPRGDLLSAGFVFNNRIGAGEKPILSGIVTVDGQEVDLTTHRFLTQTEINAVMEQQRKAQPDFPHPDTSEMEDLRRDILGFLIKGTELVTHEGETEINVALAVLRNLLDKGTITQGQLSQYVEKERSGWTKLGYSEDDADKTTLGFLFQAAVAGLDLVRLRRIPITASLMRFGKLRDIPSPFLDSGFRFDDNWDLTLNTNNGKNTKRINMVVWHLMSRGFGEMGGSINGSHDQTYMTGPEYMQDIYSKRADEKESLGEITDEDKKTIALRMQYRIAPDTVKK